METFWIYLLIGMTLSWLVGVSIQKKQVSVELLGVILWPLMLMMAMYNVSKNKK